MSPQPDSNQVFIKLIFLVLSALFLVMTSIGGFTASHVISQVDGIAESMNQVKTDIAVGKAQEQQRDARIANIENFIYSQQGAKFKPAKPE